MKIRKEITCPLELTHDIIKGKWKPIIILNLKEKRSLSSLEKSIHGISQKMLLEHLKDLMEFKIVDKISFGSYPNGAIDPDYCVLKFSAERMRIYQNFKSEIVEIA